MISKPVPANSFYHTCRYVANKPGAELLIAEGVRTHSFKLMAEDFRTQQQLRPEKKKACFHSILSFYPGEKPSDETMKEIAVKYLKALGIVNTQYAISKHTDRAHLHMHIVANMVDNNGKAISDSWVGLRGKKIAQQLTEEYGLVPATEKNLGLTNLKALSNVEATKYKIYMAISGTLPHCRNMEELEARLWKRGIQTLYKYKGQTKERQGVSFRLGEISFKGSQVDRKFSLLGLERTLAQQQSMKLEKNQGIIEMPHHKNINYNEKPLARTNEKANNKNETGEKLASEIANAVEKTIGVLIDVDRENPQLQYGQIGKPIKKKKRKKRGQSLGN